jgi:hypothetical protein
VTHPTVTVRELLTKLASVEDELRRTPTHIQDSDGRTVPNPQLTRLALKELAVIDALHDQSAVSHRSPRKVGAPSDVQLFSP